MYEHSYIYCSNKNSLGQTTTKIITPHVFLDTFFPFKINEFQIFLYHFWVRYTHLLSRLSMKYGIVNSVNRILKINPLIYFVPLHFVLSEHRAGGISIRLRIFDSV